MDGLRGTICVWTCSILNTALRVNSMQFSPQQIYEIKQGFIQSTRKQLYSEEKIKNQHFCHILLVVIHKKADILCLFSICSQQVICKHVVSAWNYNSPGTLIHIYISGDSGTIRHQVIWATVYSNFRL